MNMKKMFLLDDEWRLQGSSRDTLKEVVQYLDTHSRMIRLYLDNLTICYCWKDIDGKIYYLPMFNYDNYLDLACQNYVGDEFQQALITRLFTNINFKNRSPLRNILDWNEADEANYIQEILNVGFIIHDEADDEFYLYSKKAHSQFNQRCGVNGSHFTVAPDITAVAAYAASLIKQSLELIPEKDVMKKNYITAIVREEGGIQKIFAALSENYARTPYSRCILDVLHSATGDITYWAADHKKIEAYMEATMFYLSIKSDLQLPEDAPRPHIYISGSDTGNSALKVRYLYQVGADYILMDKSSDIERNIEENYDGIKKNMKLLESLDNKDYIWFPLLMKWADNVTVTGDPELWKKLVDDILKQFKKSFCGYPKGARILKSTLSSYFKNFKKVLLKDLIEILIEIISDNTPEYLIKEGQDVLGDISRLLLETAAVKMNKKAYFSKKGIMFNNNSSELFAGFEITEEKPQKLKKNGGEKIKVENDDVYQQLTLASYYS